MKNYICFKAIFVYTVQSLQSNLIFSSPFYDQITLMLDLRNYKSSSMQKTLHFSWWNLAKRPGGGGMGDMVRETLIKTQISFLIAKGSGNSWPHLFFFIFIYLFCISSSNKFSE